MAIILLCAVAVFITLAPHALSSAASSVTGPVDAGVPGQTTTTTPVAVEPPAGETKTETPADDDDDDDDGTKPADDDEDDGTKTETPADDDADDNDGTKTETPADDDDETKTETPADDDADDADDKDDDPHAGLPADGNDDKTPAGSDPASGDVPESELPVAGPGDDGAGTTPTNPPVVPSESTHPAVLRALDHAANDAGVGVDVALDRITNGAIDKRTASVDDGTGQRRAPGAANAGIRAAGRRMKRSLHMWCDDALPEHRLGNVLRRMYFADGVNVSPKPMCPRTIDAVYTWVNGTDPDQSYIKDFFQGKTPKDEGKMLSDSAILARFRDSGELRWSLRSLFQHAPWIRNVYIVTNGQVPTWLNVTHPRLRIVTHADIFPDKAALPTFNSNAIEAHLNRIRGLSDWFMYFNDDFFLASRVNIGDVLSPTRGVVLPVVRSPHASFFAACAKDCNDSLIGNGVCNAACDVEACMWDLGDCSENRAALPHSAPDACAPGCANAWLADGMCDAACDTAACGWDLGDCHAPAVDGKSNTLNDTAKEADAMLRSRAEPYAAYGRTLAAIRRARVASALGVDFPPEPETPPRFSDLRRLHAGPSVHVPESDIAVAWLSAENKVVTLPVDTRVLAIDLVAVLGGSGVPVDATGVLIEPVLAFPATPSRITPSVDVKNEPASGHFGSHGWLVPAAPFGRPMGLHAGIAPRVAPARLNAAFMAGRGAFVVGASYNNTAAHLVSTAVVSNTQLKIFLRLTAAGAQSADAANAAADGVVLSVDARTAANAPFQVLVSVKRDAEGQVVCSLVSAAKGAAVAPKAGVTARMPVVDPWPSKAALDAALSIKRHIITPPLPAAKTAETYDTVAKIAAPVQQQLNALAFGPSATTVDGTNNGGYVFAPLLSAAKKPATPAVSVDPYEFEPRGVWESPARGFRAAGDDAVAVVTAEDRDDATFRAHLPGAVAETLVVARPQGPSSRQRQRFATLASEPVPAVRGADVRAALADVTDPVAQVSIIAALARRAAHGAVPAKTVRIATEWAAAQGGVATIATRAAGGSEADILRARLRSVRPGAVPEDDDEDDDGEGEDGDNGDNGGDEDDGNREAGDDDNSFPAGDAVAPAARVSRTGGRKLLSAWESSLKHTRRSGVVQTQWYNFDMPSHVMYLFNRHVLAEMNSLLAPQLAVSARNHLRATTDVNFPYAHMTYLSGARWGTLESHGATKASVEASDVQAASAIDIDWLAQRHDWDADGVLDHDELQALMGFAFPNATADERVAMAAETQIALTGTAPRTNRTDPVPREAAASYPPILRASMHRAAGMLKYPINKLVDKYARRVARYIPVTSDKQALRDKMVAAKKANVKYICLNDKLDDADEEVYALRDSLLREFIPPFDYTYGRGPKTDECPMELARDAPRNPHVYLRELLPALGLRRDEYGAFHKL